MECNKDEAERAKQIAENKMKTGDFMGAQKFAEKAQRLYPEIDNISQLLTVCKVHCSAQSKVLGAEMDWYGILQIELFADEMTIKKQYRKLALLLHPDKNKFSGAEAAFKLIGEANRVLMDQTKRSVYDMKCRASVKATVPKPPGGHSRTNSQGKKQNGATNSFPARLRPFQQAQWPTFWTCCPACNVRYQYYWEFVNKVLRCQSCQEIFLASDLTSQGVPPGSSWNQFPNQKEVPNQGPVVGAPHNNFGMPSATGFSDEFRGLDPESKAGRTTKVCGVAKTKLNKDTALDIKGEKGDVGSMPKPKKVNIKESGTSRNLCRKRGRKSQEESGGYSKVGSHNYGEENLFRESDGVLGGQNAGINGCNQSRRSSRQKQHVSYKEDLSEDDFVSPPRQTERSNSSIHVEEGMKRSGPDCAVSNNDGSDATATAVNNHEKESRQTASAPPEKSLQNKQRKSLECNAREKVETMPNQDDEKSESNDDSSLSGSNSEAEPNPMIFQCPDPEFSDFEKERAEGCFAVNQLWAVFDTADGMPRFYARVKKVYSPGFKLLITWLEPNPVDQGKKVWCDEELPVACGKYKAGSSQETHDHLMFSHRMTYTSGRSKYAFFIHPRKGETWALFRNWDIKWSLEPEKHKPPYQFDIVEVLSDFDENVGIYVGNLGKVKGFTSLFQQTESLGMISFWIPSSELYRFSHRIPSCKMTGEEREGVPVGSFELDPASLPTNLDGLARHDHMKAEHECSDTAGNVECSKSPKGKMKPGMGSERIYTAKKQERTDPEQEMLVFGRSPRESNGAGENKRQVNVSSSMNEENGGEDVSNGNLNQAGECATSCQAGGSINTPKKPMKNDLAGDAIKLRRSPRASRNRNTEVMASDSTMQEVIDKHSEVNKDENCVSISHFERSLSSGKTHMQLRDRSPSGIIKSRIVGARV